jgi:hypothetical protein
VRIELAPTEKARDNRMLLWCNTDMENTVVVALISSGGSVLIGITALLLNYRGFVSIERRLDLMQADMKDLNKTMTALEIDVARL